MVFPRFFAFAFQVILALCIGFQPLALTGSLASGGFSGAPLKRLPEPPAAARLLGEGRETETEQQSTKKKTMKTKHTKSIVSTTTTSTPHSALSTPHSEEKGLPSRPEQPRTDTASGDTSAFSLQPSAFPSTPHSAFRAPHSIDFARRWANRQLGTQALLSLLRTEAPRFYPLAEVVGKWVWIQFPDKQSPEVTRTLAQLGFHWNNKRQLWQHPCGPATDGSPEDPREKYGSFHAADAQPV